MWIISGVYSSVRYQDYCNTAIENLCYVDWKTELSLFYGRFTYKDYDSIKEDPLPFVTIPIRSWRRDLGYCFKSQVIFVYPQLTQRFECFDIDSVLASCHYSLTLLTSVIYQYQHCPIYQTLQKVRYGRCPTSRNILIM